MLKLFKRSQVEEYQGGDQFAKLSADLKKKLFTQSIGTTLNIIATVATPFITHNIAENIHDDFGRKSINSAGAIITAYQLEKTIDSIRKTKSTLAAYEASLKMSSEPIVDTVVSGKTTIELNSNEWNSTGDGEVAAEESDSDDEDDSDPDAIENLIVKFADLVEASQKVHGTIQMERNGSEDDTDPDPQSEDENNFIVHIGDPLLDIGDEFEEDEEDLRFNPDEEEWVPEKKRY